MNKQRSYFDYLVLPIILLAFVLRLYRLDVQSLWFDEIVIIEIARLPWYDGLVAALGQGMQLTPVFHGIIKLWLPIGSSDWLVRIPAVFFGVMTIPVVFKLGRFYFNANVALFAALIFAINPYQIWYSQELKLYAILPMIAGGSMLAFGQMVKTRGRRGFILLTFFNLTGLPTHYFMFLIVTVQFLYLVITFKRNHPLLLKWVVAQLIGVTPLLLWWIFIWRQQFLTVGIGWIPQPDWKTLLITVWNLTYVYTGYWPIFTIVALAVLFFSLSAGLWFVWRRKPDWALLLALWLFLPPVVVWLMSFGRISFYVDRYFLIVSPVLGLFIAYGLLCLSPRWLQIGLIIIFFTATGLGLWGIYFDRDNFTKEDWRTLARRLDTEVSPDDVVFACTDGHRLALNYYNPRHGLRPETVLVAGEKVSSSYKSAWVIQAHPRALPVHYLAEVVPPALDETQLSPAAAVWHRDHLQRAIKVPNLSAYQYRLEENQFLPLILSWHCEQRNDNNR